MRHNKKFNHLGRKSAHRKAMLANMAASLIVYKRIKTTVAKAKALRVYVEPLITKSKTDSTHSRRVIFSYLKDKEAVTELFREVANKVADRPGGYTRILKTGNRLGDNAEMCFIELVDYNELYSEVGKVEAKPKTRRSRRRGGSKPGDETTAPDTEAVVTEDKPESVDEVAEVVEETEVQTEETPVVETSEVKPEEEKIESVDKDKEKAAELKEEETVKEDSKKPEPEKETSEVKEEKKAEKPESDEKVTEVAEEVADKTEETPVAKETIEKKPEEKKAEKIEKVVKPKKTEKKETVVKAEKKVTAKKTDSKTKEEPKTKEQPKKVVEKKEAEDKKDNKEEKKA